MLSDRRLFVILWRMSRLSYDLRGKRLLFVGASGHFTPAIETAKRMGIYTIAINYASNAVGKRFADMAADVDTYCPKDVLRFAQGQRIDGLFTSWNEVNIYTTEWVARQMGLPFYGTKEQLDQLITKNAFKDTCRKYNVPVVPEYYVGGDLTEQDIENFEYPVIFKPTDSGGTRGMTILQDESGVAEAYQKAMEASIAKKIVVEKYLKDTKLIVIDFVVQDDEAYIACVADRSTVRDSDERVPLAVSFMYPSEYIDIVEKQALSQLKAMIKGLGIRNGIISIEGMISEGKLYIIETQFRWGGTHFDKYVKSDTGVDLMEMTIEYALTGKFDSHDLKRTMNPRFKGIYACQNLQMNSGKIAKIGNIDQVKKLPGVDWFIQLKNVGETIVEDGSTARNFAKIGLSGDNRRELYILMDQIQSILQVEDESGRDMVIHNIPLSYRQ